MSSAPSLISSRSLRSAALLALGLLLAAAASAVLAAGAAAEAKEQPAPARSFGFAAAAPEPSALPERRAEVHLDLGLQTRVFPQRGTLGQDRVQPSSSLRLEYRSAWNDGRDALVITPFLRVDAMDERRTHFDLREAYYSRIGDGFELHIGARRVFWGRTESLHLVDVINQSDFVEHIDGEERLGQPMAQLVVPHDAGALELFLLPGARARTFPSTDGRLAGPVRIDADARFTGGADALQTSWAARWSHFVGDLEFGLAHFSGTAREPEFEVAGAITIGEPIRLRPVYETVALTSLDAQYILGDLALKLELLNRRGQGPRSTAFVTGLERTFVGAFGTRMDLGVLLEYLFDDRHAAATQFTFDDDLFVAARLALNDHAGTTALIGLLGDPRSGEHLLTIEASRRLGARWRMALDVRLFDGARATAPGDLAALVAPDRGFGALMDDDYLQFEFTRYF